MMHSTPDDDEPEEPGRILSDSEYAAKAGARKDIFSLYYNHLLLILESSAFILAIVTGVILSIDKTLYVDAAPDFYEIRQKERMVKFLPIDFDNDNDKCMCEDEVKRRKMYDYGGDPRIRKSRKNCKVDIAGNQIRKKSVSSAYLSAKGGFSDNLDALLIGNGGLNGDGEGSIISESHNGIGYNAGYGSGFPSGYSLLIIRDTTLDIFVILYILR